MRPSPKNKPDSKEIIREALSLVSWFEEACFSGYRRDKYPDVPYAGLRGALKRYFKDGGEA
jgi:hypothetical protein